MHAVDDAPQNRILRVAKEAKARRDKAAAIEAKKRAAREAEEAAREEQKRQERIAYVQHGHRPPPSPRVPWRMRACRLSYPALAWHRWSEAMVWQA